LEESFVGEVECGKKGRWEEGEKIEKKALSSAFLSAI